MSIASAMPISSASIMGRLGRGCEFVWVECRDTIIDPGSEAVSSKKEEPTDSLNCPEKAGVLSAARPRYGGREQEMEGERASTGARVPGSSPGGGAISHSGVSMSVVQEAT